MKTVNKKSFIINSIIILIVTGFTFFYLLKDGVISPETLSQTKWYHFFIVFAFFVLGIFVISLVDFFIYKSVVGNNMPLYKCVINSCFGNLGSNATPFKSGHFPLKVYYQLKQGISFDKSLTAIIKCQVVYSITSILMYFSIFLILVIRGDSIYFYGSNIGLWTVALVGFCFHSLVFLAIILLSFFTKLQNFCLKIWGKFLVKIKKVKDLDSYTIEQKIKLNTYKGQIISVVKHIYKYIHTIILYASEMAITGSFQYIAYLLFTDKGFNLSTWFAFYVLNLATTYITNIIPIPGGGGGAEIMFNLIFVSIIDSAILGSVLVLWRFSTYYMVIIAEFIVFAIFSIIKGKKKQSLSPIKSELPNENIDPYDNLKENDDE